MDVKNVVASGDQEVKVFGTERMVLVDCLNNGAAIAVAERTGGHTWTVTDPTGQVDPITAETRSAALDAMYDEVSLVTGDATGHAVVEPNFFINDEIVTLRDLDDYLATHADTPTE